jgi:hypothetical protein
MTVLKHSNQSGSFACLKILTQEIFWLNNDYWPPVDGSVGSRRYHASFMDFQFSLSHRCFSRIHGFEQSTASSGNNFERLSFPRNPVSKQSENLQFLTRRFHLISQYLNTVGASNTVVHRSKT